MFDNGNDEKKNVHIAHVLQVEKISYLNKKLTRLKVSFQCSGTYTVVYICATILRSEATAAGGLNEKFKLHFSRITTLHHTTTITTTTMMIMSMTVIALTKSIGCGP